MQIEWWTLAIQAINFVILVWLLSRFLYRPVKDVIAKRKALADRAFAEAEASKKAAAAERLRYSEERTRLAQERRDIQTKVHEEMEDERRKVLAQAEDEAAGLRLTTRQSMAKERDTILTEIRGQVASLAIGLASDLLSNADAGSVNDAFLNQLMQKLSDLTSDERRHLMADLAADGARVRIVTATSLTAGEQATWTQRLGAELSRAVEADFATDPAILGGAEIHFPHAVVKATWADQLKGAAEAMRSNATAS